MKKDMLNDFNVMNVRVTLLEDCLGMSPNDRDVYSDYIASKVADKDKKEEEILAVGIDEYVDKQMTVFPKDKEGNPFFWDYQIKGFFKDTCSALQRCKGEEHSKESCKIKAYKKVIDGCIFPIPRKIKINLSGEMGKIERPLRASTPQGERIALASSETIPAGSTIEFQVILLNKNHEDVVIEWLNYGVFKGFGQWRNAGWGRFVYELYDRETGEVIGGNKMLFGEEIA